MGVGFGTALGGVGPQAAEFGQGKVKGDGLRQKLPLPKVGDASQLGGCAGEIWTWGPAMGGMI